MTIFLEDILNLEFTTNLRRGIPVSVKQKVKRGRFVIGAGEGKDAPSANYAKKV